MAFTNAQYWLVVDFMCLKRILCQTMSDLSNNHHDKSLNDVTFNSLRKTCPQLSLQLANVIIYIENTLDGKCLRDLQTVHIHKCD